MSDSREKLLNLGFGNYILESRVLAILAPDSSPMKRLRDEARDRGHLIDTSQGRKTRSILVCDSNHVFLSAVAPDTLSSRFAGLDKEDI